MNTARTLHGWSGQLRGDDAMAVRHLRPALEFARGHGLARFEANILGELGVSTARLGDHDAARAMYAQARAACEANEDVEVASATWGAVGDIATELGDLEGAESAYRHALRGRLADRALRGVAGLAGVKVSRGEWEEAALLLGALLSWNNVMHFLRVQAERSLGRLREAVPPEELERLLECGYHLTFQEVVERWSA